VREFAQPPRGGPVRDRCCHDDSSPTNSTGFERFGARAITI
jgi:hypothetical protein